MISNERVGRASADAWADGLNHLCTYTVGTVLRCKFRKVRADARTPVDRRDGVEREPASGGRKILLFVSLYEPCCIVIYYIGHTVGCGVHRLAAFGLFGRSSVRRRAGAEKLGKLDGFAGESRKKSNVVRGAFYNKSGPLAARRDIIICTGLLANY